MPFLRRSIALIALLAPGACGTAAGGPGSMAALTSDAGVEDAALDVTLSDAAASGTVQKTPFTLRSASISVEPQRVILRLRDYVANCGIYSAEAGAPPPRAMSVHVVILNHAPGEERIVYADQHAATFQIGVNPADALTYPAKSGLLHLDNFSTTPGDVVTGALELEGEPGMVNGSFSATVCPPSN